MLIYLPIVDMCAELLDGENYNVKHPIILSIKDNGIMEESKQTIPLTAEDKQMHHPDHPSTPSLILMNLFVVHFCKINRPMVNNSEVVS